MEPSRAPRKVVIRVREALLRDTLTTWVDALPGCVVAGAVSSGAALTRLCELRSPDIAVVQLGAADHDDLALLSALRGVRPGPHVLCLHGGLDSRKLLTLHRAGAHRLINTRSGTAALRAALVQAGDPARAPYGTGLSERELEILALISAGSSAAEIAEVLGISQHTVINHTRRVFVKLGVHSRTQAAAEMCRLGLRARRRDLVAGRAGATRDAVARALMADPAGTRPPVSVLVQPTESTWHAGEDRLNKIVIVEPDRRNMAVDAVLRGARAVLSTSDVATHLPAVVALVRAGYLVAPDEVVRVLARGTGPGPCTLTRRERDILDSIARGDSVRETANALGIAVKTVESEQRQLFSKLGAHNRAGALTSAREMGLLDT